MTNSDEFEQFMRDYQNMVYSTAVRLLGNETDAADISQEVFLKAFEHYTELSGNARRGGWLRTVTTNLCLHHLSRYRSRWRFFSEMFTGGEYEEDYSETLPAPDPAALPGDTAHQQRTLEAAVHALPAAQRVPLVLYHFEQLSYEDISRQLGISLGKVKTDIHRAREALRRKLKMTPEGDVVPSLPPPASPGRIPMACI
jgi:RNA polymerase sigma-70 factor, ECF subfamily